MNVKVKKDQENNNFYKLTFELPSCTLVFFCIYHLKFKYFPKCDGKFREKQMNKRTQLIFVGMRFKQFLVCLI